MARAFGTNQRIADRLLGDGLITKEQHAGALEYAARHKTRVEEALLDLEAITEPDLLKFISTLHGTRFVSTEKLSKAAIEPRLLARVNAKIATLHGVFPVLFDDRTGALSVVTADPDNELAKDELRIASGVKQVVPFVARPAAVRAAIQMHYFNDRNAFVALLRGGGLDLMQGAPDPFARSKAPAPPQEPPRPRLADAPSNGGLDVNFAFDGRVQPTDTRGRPLSAPQPVITSVAAPPPAPPPAPVASLPPVYAAPATTPSVSIPAPPVAPAPDFTEMLNVLVTLLESSRQDLRGHSSTVSRLLRKSCERIGLAEPSVNAIALAGYVHDLGKMGTYHLTPLNVAEYEGHLVAAQKVIELPSQLVASVGLSSETLQAVAGMYERWDGRGFPFGQSGKEIPLGARVLAVVDTYADITQNPRNPFRKVLRPFEACEVLAQYKGTVFDPNVVDLFRQAMTGDDMRQKLLHDRRVVLVADPDPEETTVLELRLVEQGFEVRIARTFAHAKSLIDAGDIEAVVCEMDLDGPDAGLALREQALRDGRELTWVFLTSKADRQSAQKAFDLGVDDFVQKPAAPDLFSAKLRQLIDRRMARGGKAAAGVSGSLAEMSLPDIVQILWHGRKTCALRITSRASSGEIEFTDGQVVNARWDQVRGEDAFYRLITLRDGDFRLDPTFRPTTRTIQASPEALLLEGMRRFDESSV
jgi:response regulator RpfG family c-di-GMP phosphodiesterase